MKIKIVDGNFVVDIYEFFENLVEQVQDEEDPETYQDMLDELFEKLQWYHPVYQKLITTMRREYCASNYNSTIFKLLKDFFLLSGEYDWVDKEDRIVKQMTHVIKELLGDNAKLEAETRLLRNSPHKLYRWLQDYENYSQDSAYRLYSKLLSFQRKEGDNDLTYLDIKKEMVDEIDNNKLKDFVQDWVNEVYALLDQDENVK